MTDDLARAIAEDIKADWPDFLREAPPEHVSQAMAGLVRTSTRLAERLAARGYRLAATPPAAVGPPDAVPSPFNPYRAGTQFHDAFEEGAAATRGEYGATPPAAVLPAGHPDTWPGGTDAYAACRCPR